jgi:hypothetical protein
VIRAFFARVSWRSTNRREDQMKKTREVCKLLKVSYNRVVCALRAEKLPAPSKDISGDYAWSQKDIEALRKALAVDRRFKLKAVMA